MMKGGPIGGKDGFGIESGGNRETGKGLRLGSTREVSSTASSRKDLLEPFIITSLTPFWRTYSVLNDAWQHTP
jgi:hypothetical protein